MKNRNIRLLLIVTFVLFVLVVAVFSIVLWQQSPYWVGLEKKVFYASVNISEGSGGFDLNATALTFGKIRAGGDVASRSIIFENSYNIPVIARVSSEGKISPILTYEKEVYAEKGETVKIGFSVTSSNSTSVGFYDGYVRIKVVPAI